MARILPRLWMYQINSRLTGEFRCAIATFRTMHGFATWALATRITSILVAYAVAAMIGGVAKQCPAWLPHKREWLLTQVANRKPWTTRSIPSFTSKPYA